MPATLERVTDWTAFDYEQPQRTGPRLSGDFFWVFEADVEQAVTIGRWLGDRWELWGGDGEGNITHWAPMGCPEPPVDDRVGQGVVPTELRPVIDRIAAERGVTRSALLQQAVREWAAER